MNITITQPPLGGSAAAIASKSHAHRALIAAALSDSQTQVTCGELNDDIRATVHCLQALGADMPYAGGVYSVTPITHPIAKASRTLPCAESGSTLRFVLPVACALGTDARFTMDGRLPKRPLSPLYEELTAHGCSLSAQGTSPLAVSGQLTGGAYTIAGNISSQFVTGLLLALPLLHEDSRIEIAGMLESRPYVDITLQTLSQFGIHITEEDHGFRIPGGQRYRSPGALTVEGDWSNAACWLALGAFSKTPVTVTGLNLESPQGDRAMLGILAGFGAKITQSGSTVTVGGGTLRGMDVDAAATPDLVPVIAAVALSAKGQTRIFNAQRLRLKESDRLASISHTLQAFGAQIAETADGLLITGGRKLHGATINSANDHRIAMMAATVSPLCDGEVTIEQADAVNKSYPRFFDDLRALGGQTREELP